ncbi:MAG: alpha-2-macroglobulin [Myxococcaceae bacterium]|nr:alpha-2-macroglobulin [Myxococcaceae bacterium]
MTAVRSFFVLALAGLIGCGGRDDKRGQTPTDKVGLVPDNLPRQLAPLPEAPDIRIGLDSAPTTDLTVVVSRPQGDWKGEVRPTITFSKPVKSLEMVEAQRAADKETPFGRIEPALKGEWRWLGSASVEFVPEGLVPYATTYTVTVMKGLRAIDGSRLAADHRFTFNTPKPEIQQVFPASGFNWVKPGETFKLLFNQPIKEADLAAAAVFEIEGGEKLKARVVSRVSIAEEKRLEAEKAKKEGRSYEPLDAQTRGYKNQQTRYELVAEKPLPLDKRVTLRIDANLRAEQGPLTLGTEAVYGWKTYGPMKLMGTRFCAHLGDCPYGPLVVLTSNEADLESFKSRVTIEPPIDIDWEHSEVEAPNGSDPSPYISLAAKWKPDTQYKISVASGTLDVFKQKDEKGLSSADRTSELEPQLNIGPYEALIEASEKRAPALPVELVNLQTLHVQLWHLTLAEMALGVANDDTHFATQLSRPADSNEDVALSYPRNQARVHGIELGKLFNGKRSGFALVALQSPQLPRYGRANEMTTFRSLVQVTDLAVHLKVAPKKSLAWVTRLSTGEPVQSAAMTVFNQNGKQLWSGTTDAQGFADVPGTVDLKLKSSDESWEFPKVVVTAEKDGDQAVTVNTWSSGIEPYEFGLSQAWEAERAQSSGFIFTDRGVYRPGDKVYVKGVMRYRVLGQLRGAAENSSFAVTVNDSRRDKVKTETVKVNKYGTFSMAFDIPKEAPTGYFNIEVKGKAPQGVIEMSESFRVEEYRAPQFRVDVSTPSKDKIAGEKVSASVSARYLFGGAMNDAKVRWSAHRSSTVFSTPSAPDFTFAQETWWWDDNRPADSSGFFASGEGKSNAQGLLPIDVGQVEAPGERPYTYTVEGEVEDVNRQRVAGRAEVRVHPSAYYVGLRASTGFMTLGNEYPLDTVVVDPQGERVKGRKVEVKIASRTWKSVKKKDATGGFTVISEPEETVVHQCALTSAADPVPCKFKPASAGFFVVRANVKDDAQHSHTASLGVYATGSEFVAWQRNDNDRIELVPDKTSYQVGEVAKVLVKSPYPEANAVFSLEREGVLERRFMKLKGSVTAVDVPITEEMVPNIFAGVLLVRPRVETGGLETGDDPGRPAARVGLIKLNVERKTKRLSVTVKTDKAEYQPGQPVDVEVQVKDWQGKATPAEVTLFVVDEAVLRLTDYKTPDPMNSLFAERGLSVRMGEPLLNLVRMRGFGEKGEARGGGGGAGEGKGFRTDFKTTVIFEPGLEAADGVLKHRFTLPDNLTTFRVMAVAVTNQERFGSGDASIQVSKPVLALPAMPRFARVGDTFEAGVVVHSRAAADTEVTVTASVTGAVQLQGSAAQQVAMKAGAPKEVRFAFKATEPGSAAFRFKVTQGAEQDGVEEKILVERITAIEAVATYGDTQNQSVEGLVPPKDVDPTQGGLELTFASTSLGNFQQGFQQLIEYPYGCLEQQSSRLVPFVALREISGQFGVPWPGPDAKKLKAESTLNAWLNRYLFSTLDVKDESDPDAVINKTVKSIVALQDEDGAFRYWPSSYCADSWMSAFATLSLYRAREVGFEVPPDRITRAEGYLANVAGGSCHPCEWGCPDETRVMAAYVLARMKKPKPSYYADFYARRDKLPLFSRALLANAMYTGGGDKKKAQALMQEIINHAKESPQGVQLAEVQSNTYATLWHSDTRTTAVALQTLTALSPEHPFVGKMQRYLTSIRQGDGEWRSTQEAAWSLMALTDVIRTKERETPDFVAKATLGEKVLAEKNFKGRSMKVEAESVPMASLLAAAKGDASKLTLSKKGAGTLYYTALMKYAANEPKMTPLDNGIFVQRWFEPYAGGGQAKQFYAGDLVRVRLRVASNQERHWAVFEVPLPAGLEPVNTTLGTTAQLTSTPTEEQRGVGYAPEGEEDQEGGEAEGYRPRSPWAAGFYSPFNHVEQRDSRVMLFADHLPAGVHVTSFVARATTPGNYVLKPARGSLMYEPEVWGRSEGGRFEVTLPTPLSQK